jgi:DNA polymerase III subunit delta'
VLSLSAVAGHARLTTLLSQAIARGTLPPTLLFSGRAGVGKFLTAHAVAATLNCTSPVENVEGLAIDACGKCRACDRVARAMHVDVILLEADERASIKIDVVREVLTRTGYRPFEGRRRVVIIRDAETLEPASQNALLKSLEEPPSSTSFILTTAIPGILLPTVRSRCMQLRFGRLTDADVARVLETEGVAPDEARAAAAVAGGSVGQALSLGSSDVGGLRALALRLLRSAAATPVVAGRLQVAGDLAGGGGKKDRSREELGLVLRLAASMIRDIEALNSGSDDTLLANSAVAEDLRRMQAAYGGGRGRAAFSDLMRAIVALDRPSYAGTKVVADWISVQI